MPDRVDDGRRRFLRSAAAMMTAARLGLPAKLDASHAPVALAEADPLPRELAAIAAAAEWLNSPRLTAADLTGQVVLVDFWTYTCINWLRTLPYVRAWSQKYPRLRVIGVHAPEFPFEHNVDNVRRSLRQMNIDYPVVIDNGYSVWRAFNNQYWPALYLIDAKGKLRHHQFGEGEYERTETTIQRLLTDAGASLNGTQAAGSGTQSARSGTQAAKDMVRVEGGGLEAPADWSSLRSPENYVGYDRMERFASSGGARQDQPHVYSAPRRLSLNEWALTGEWTIGKQAAVLKGASGRIAYRFHSRDLHLVMSPPRQGPIRYRVSIDAQPPGAARG
ncbi:MAG TPA: thioredoxin-like domain-containing protein, partial [Vicinamibacterales bacterium]|nr:thioredoxin-like domain-containing protein [Vicinamibacterales bacterium]